MKKTELVPARKIVEMCGSYEDAVDAIMDLGRVMWDMALLISPSEKEGKRHNYRELDRERLAQSLSYPVPELLPTLLSKLREKGLCWALDKPWLSIHLDIFRPLALPRSLLANLKEDQDLQYYVRRSIRKHYHCAHTSETVRLFNLLAKTINSKLALIEDLPKPTQSSEAEESEGVKPEGGKPRFDYEEMIKDLSGVLQEARQLPEQESLYPPEQAEMLIKLFVECCREAGFLQAHNKLGRVALKTEFIDVEYLLSNLFGMPTGMRGFDDLFGSGGLMLADNIEGIPSKQKGRTVLIKGRFGTGKTLLSLLLAVEVARKGGIAWVIPLEQSAEECLYTLESMGALPNDPPLFIADNPNSTAEVLENVTSEAGVLIILKKSRNSLDDFLVTLEEDAKQMSGYPLRLISVDPINSIDLKEKGQSQIRAETLDKFDAIESNGTNVLLVTEEGTDPEKKFMSEENIADTVIRLSVDTQHDYAHRYFEIKKSRFQREQRGEHPFSIVPGEGIKIFPSSAAIRAKIRTRRMREPHRSISFGLPSLDNILGEKAIQAGDVIVLQGREGLFKTPLGLLFLLGSKKSQPENKVEEPPEPNPQNRRLVTLKRTLPKETRPDETAPTAGGGGTSETLDEDQESSSNLRPRSLLVSARDSKSTIQHMLRQEFVIQHIRANETPKKIEDIQICSLSGGHITPGYIFQQIEDEILKARLRGFWVDRVMIDDVAYWEMSCPFIRDDETFGDTLVDFLRRNQVTSLLACGELAKTKHSVVQQAIIDAADCTIEFDQLEFRGINHVMVRVSKTRGMRHRRESFELISGPKTLEIKPSSSLLRVGRGGEVTPVKIQLFLHSETRMQEEYNASFLAAITAILSRYVEIDSPNLIFRDNMIGLGSSSAVDELQIVQIDEFQMTDQSNNKDQNLTLQSFPATQWNGDGWNDFMPRLVERCRPTGKSFWAVPYYENISLLAYRSDQLGSLLTKIGGGRSLEAVTTDWGKLADLCDAWETKHAEEKGHTRGDDCLFFEFPRVTSENYNCLFFEILLSISQKPSKSGHCNLRDWLRSAEAIKASEIYRRLCRRAYRVGLSHHSTVQGAHFGKEPRGYDDKGLIVVNPQAIVWRHWYSTLNQMMSGLSLEEREQINVVPLPNEITMAGEWYLGIPAYSAAPDVGLEIIKLLTNQTAELERVRSGIGLPTRSNFYGVRTGSFTGISPYFSMDSEALQNLVSKAFRRSNFDCYSQFSHILSYYLQRIIELPEGTEQGVRTKINTIFDSMEARMELIRLNRDCGKCLVKGIDQKHQG